jgi:hypothetical protein
LEIIDNGQFTVERSEKEKAGELPPRARRSEHRDHEESAVETG